MIKVCTKCKVGKEESADFYKKKNGFRTVCISCMCEEKRLYRKTPEYREKYEDYKKRATKKSRKEYFRQRRKNNILYKIKDNVGSSIRNCLRGKLYTKNSRTYEILGCTFEEFKIYIESKFEPWMNWNNHGIYSEEYGKTWQLDHIVPISSAKSEDEIIKLHHYTNYQPLDSKINIIDKRDLVL